MTRLGLGLVAALALCACPGGGGSGGGGGTGGSGGGAGGGAGGGGGGSSGGGTGNTNPLPAGYNGEGSVVLVSGTGSVVVAGLVSVPDSGTFIDMMAAKFDGTLARDTAFGTNGVATVDWDGDGSGVISLDNDFAYGATFDGDKVVLAGSVRGIDIGGRDAALARLTATGALDTTFGAGAGKTQLAHDPTFDTAFRNVAVVAGGKYLACGSYGSQLFAMRFNADGTADNSFTDGTSAQGVVLTAEGSCTSMTMQGANVLIGGETTRVARLSASGAQDMTFGTANGLYADDSNLGGIFIRTDGKLWLVGIRTDGSNVTYLHQVLLSADGVPDGSFGTNGVKEQQIDLPTALLGAAQQGDKLVLHVGAYGAGQFSALMRVNADGTLDSTFGTAGVYSLPFKGTQGHSLVGSRNHLTVANNVAYIGYVQPLDVDPFNQFVIFKYALP